MCKPADPQYPSSTQIHETYYSTISSLYLNHIFSESLHTHLTYIQPTDLMSVAMLYNFYNIANFPPKPNKIWLGQLCENYLSDLNCRGFENGRWIKCSELQLDLWTDRLSLTLASSQPFPIGFFLIIIAIALIALIIMNSIYCIIPYAPVECCPEIFNLTGPKICKGNLIWTF